MSGEIEVGDRLTIRLKIETDRNLKYVHWKDFRVSGLEPANILSKYQYQDGLRYYHLTKARSTNFFIEDLYKGSYVLESDLRARHKVHY